MAATTPRRQPPAPRWFQAGLPEVARLQDTLREVLQALLPIPFLWGARLDAVGLAAAATTVVSHGLGRRPIGYLVLLTTDAAPSFYITGSTETEVSFYSATACRVWLWLF